MGPDSNIHKPRLLGPMTDFNEISSSEGVNVRCDAFKLSIIFFSTKLIFAL